MFTAIKDWIIKYFWIVFLIAVAYWLILPYSASWFYNGLWVMIFIVTYISAIDIDYNEIINLKKYWKEVWLFFLIQMILLPIAIYFLVKWLSINLAEWLFLLCAAPAGMAAISFTRLMWGNTLLTLCITIGSSILVPLSLPILSHFILKSSIDIDSMGMFIDLVIYCIIPLLAGYITKTYNPKITSFIKPHIDVSTIIIIALMIAWPIWENAEIFLNTPILKLIFIVIVLFVLAFIFLWIGRKTFARKTQKEQIAWGISKCFMNISLATVIAATYFSPEVLLIVILYEFPWDLMLIPFRYIINKTEK